jgi:hypothetical protein
MTSGDSDILSTDDIVSRDDSAALLALASALVILTSWSSFLKTTGVPQPDWNRAWLIH